MATISTLGQRPEEKPSSFSTSELDDLQTTLRDFEIDGNVDEPVSLKPSDKIIIHRFNIGYWRSSICFIRRPAGNPEKGRM